MRNLYETSSLVVSYEPETAYQEDCSRAYLGIKVIANIKFAANKLILGLSGLVTECPSDIDSTPELNFSVFYRNSEFYLLQGPLSFVNHSCHPKCRYETIRGKDGFVSIRTLRDVNEGEMITVSYEKSYFGSNKVFCLCPFKEDHRSTAINALPCAPLKGTRTGKSFSKCVVLTESTDSNNVSSSKNVNTLGVLEPIEREMPVQVTGSSCNEENLEPSKSSDLGSERFSRRNQRVIENEITDESSLLYRAECEFCKKRVILTNHDFLDHIRRNHRLEAEFKCIICFRLFSGFNSFVNHVKKYELELSVSRGNDNDIYLSSQSCSTAVSADSSCDSESGASDTRDCTPNVAGIISSSFLGTQQKVYSWCQDKYREGEKSNGAFSYKFKGCDMKELTLSN